MEKKGVFLGFYLKTEAEKRDCFSGMEFKKCEKMVKISY